MTNKYLEKIAEIQNRNTLEDYVTKVHIGLMGEHSWIKDPIAAGTDAGKLHYKHLSSAKKKLILGSDEYGYFAKTGKLPKFKRKQ